MNPACDVASDELIAFTEEELPERRMRDLEAHVPACPACQERLAAAEQTMTLLRETMPEPDPHARHDLLVRLYQEAEQQTAHPHRGWAQAASLTAISGTFLLAAVMLWTGLSQLVDAIPQPFQMASQDQSQEWVGNIDENGEEMFESAPFPGSVGESYPLYDHWVRAGIRVIVYQDGDDGQMTIEVRQLIDDESEPPGYMEQMSTVQGRAVFVDEPGTIQEIYWTDNGVAHHVQTYSVDAREPDGLTPEEMEQIVLAFLED